MASETDNGPLSDTEGGERPVREQLKKAHIGHHPTAATSDPASADLPAEQNGARQESDTESRGRLQKKRSHEEVDADLHEINAEPQKQHTRKRSRDSTVEEELLNNGQRKVSGERPRNGDDHADTAMEPEQASGSAKPPRAATPEPSGEKRTEDAVEAMASPKTKRSRLHSTTTDADASLPSEKDVSAAAKPAKADKIAEEAITDAHPGDGTSAAASTAKIPPTSGFANASAVSPFGSLAGSKSPPAEAQTSASAFSASGFSALAGSSTSGFGAIGKQGTGFGSGGSFASGNKSPLSGAENEKPKSPPSSSFGGALGQQSAFASAGSGGTGFGSGASGFGKLGSPSTGGFGSGLGGTGFSSLGGGGLSSFASGKAAAPLESSSKPARPFGAPPPGDDDGEEDGDEDDKSGAKSPLAVEEEKQDERFYAQELETGEEDEKTEFSARAKLYNFALGPDGKKEWRERGLGVLRFNVKKPGEGQKPKARLLIRADGSHRVVLNTPVTKEIKFGAPTGGPPQGGYMYFMGTIDGKEGLELLQLKMKQINALDLHSQISKLQEEM